MNEIKPVKFIIILTAVSVSIAAYILDMAWIKFFLAPLFVTHMVINLITMLMISIENSKKFLIMVACSFFMCHVFLPDVGDSELYPIFFGNESTNQAIFCGGLIFSGISFIANFVIIVIFIISKFRKTNELKEEPS